jgi:RNA polymerase sigma-70 factor (ECF subfamily)
VIVMGRPELTNDLREAAAAARRTYLDGLAPFRPELYRYCRRIAGNVWDAEDLVQDTLLKGFATLSVDTSSITNPRGYLIRIATNLWIDRWRRRATEAAARGEIEPAVATAQHHGEVGSAGRILLEALAPQERAALVLKEVFDFSLSEIAGTLATSVGAVKAALHRGRGRLKDIAPARRRIASTALVDEFVRRLDAADLPRLLALMLDSATVEMPGHLLESERAQFQRKGGWLWQAVNVHPDLPADVRPPKWLNERVVLAGEPIILGFMPTAEGRLLQGITRFEEEGGKIAHVRSYCFSPELTAEVAGALGLAVGWIPYRLPTSAEHVPEVGRV